jgi:plasmid stabilization system protein ParE
VKRPVFWSEDALGELNKGIAYIAARNPTAARKVLAEIRKAGEGLGNAATGRPGRVAGTYERSVVRYPYIIAYALDALPDGRERIVVLHVIHTARDWPEGQWPSATG